MVVKIAGKKKKKKHNKQEINNHGDRTIFAHYDKCHPKKFALGGITVSDVALQNGIELVCHNNSIN